MKNTAQRFLILSLIFCASNIGIAAQTCTSAPSGLVAWYRAENNANDSKGANHGTLNSNGFAVGEVGQAFDLNNTTGITVTDNAAFNQQSVTLEGWITAQLYSCSGCAQFIAAKSGSNGTFGYELGTHVGGSLRFTINGAAGGADLFSASNVADGNFHHVGATFDGATMKVYVDGVLSAQTSITTTINYEASSPFVIGSRQRQTDTNPYNGLIDEVSFYNQALSAAEIQAIFNANSAGKCLGTTAASVQVGGRVRSANGKGIIRTRVSLTDSKGETRHTRTNLFGAYRFDNVPAGETYVISVNHRFLQFIQSSQMHFIGEDNLEINFVTIE